MVHIYILIDPETDEIRYVGQTIQSLPRRLSGHYYVSGKHHTANWMKSLKGRGLKPHIIEVDWVEDIDADAAEALYIQEYRLLSCPLTNLSDGGRATHNVSETTKRKISESKRGHVVTKDTRARISETLTGRKHPGRKKSGAPSEEHRKRISEALKGRERTEDHKRKLSEALKGNVIAETTKEKLRKHNSKTWRIVSPQGEERIITNLKKFCEENSLNHGNMVSTARGRAKSCKGWRCENYEERSRDCSV